MSTDIGMPKLRNSPILYVFESRIRQAADFKQYSTDFADFWWQIVWQNPAQNSQFCVDIMHR